MASNHTHRTVRIAAWASLIANIGIILSGGLVRLTGSGLGCDTWPRCSSESIVPTQEASIHTLIEFGNRTLTGVLLLIALFALYAVYRKASDRSDLKQFGWIQLVGILIQAAVGGGVVLLHLDWNAVGFHYLLSIVLVGLMAIFVHRTYSTPGERVIAAKDRTVKLTYLLALTMSAVIVLGVIATGSGPHSGDASDEILRTGFDAYPIYRIHAMASYALVGVTAVLFLVADNEPVERAEFTRWIRVLLVAEGFQIIVGITQATTSLPVALVSVHMVFASVLAAIVVVLIQELKTTRGNLSPEAQPRTTKGAEVTSPG